MSFSSFFIFLLASLSLFFSLLKKEKTIMPLMRDLTEVEIEERLLSSGLVIVSKPWKVLNFASWIVKKA